MEFLFKSSFSIIFEIFFSEITFRRANIENQQWIHYLPPSLYSFLPPFWSNLQMRLKQRKKKIKSGLVGLAPQKEKTSWTPRETRQRRIVQRRRKHAWNGKSWMVRMKHEWSISNSNYTTWNNMLIFDISNNV